MAIESQCPGRLWAKQVDIQVFPVTQLHVDAFWFFLYQFIVYLIYSCTMIGDLSKVLNLNQLFLKLSRLLCN